MVTPRAKTGSPSPGSYLVQQHMKQQEQASVCSPRGEAARPSKRDSRLAADALPNLMAAAMAALSCEEQPDGAVVVTAATFLPHAGTPTGEQQQSGERLSVEEVNEGVLRCCWLAHYWRLADELGICAEVSQERATYWQRMAAPVEALFYVTVSSTVASVVPGIRQAQEQAAATSAGFARQTSGCEGTEEARAAALQVCASDVVELERAMRQVSELGLVREVGVRLAMAAEDRARHLQLPGWARAGNARTAVAPLLDPDEDPSLPVHAAAPSCSSSSGGQPGSSSGTRDLLPCLPLTELESSEVRFQRAWLAYLWARAAAVGVEPHIALLRAEHWGMAACLDDARSCHQRHWCELAAARQELHLLGVELQLWQKRFH